MRFRFRTERPWLETFCIGIALVLLAPASPAASQPRSEAVETERGAPFAGLKLSGALQRLQAEGLRIVFTSNVVRPGMTILAEPKAGLDQPQDLLRELLAAHGLEARNAPNQTLVVVPREPQKLSIESAGQALTGVVRSRHDISPLEGVALRLVETGAGTVSAADGSFSISELEPGPLTVEVSRRGFVVETIEHTLVAGQSSELDILLDPAPITEEVVRVTPSVVSLLRPEPTAPVALSRDAILALPHLGDDFFRALSLLPGISGNDNSAQFNIRGGRRDETRIILDGQELYETYHLKDFDSAQSIIAPTTLESVDLSTGSFSAEHGDRMGGVLDMKTRTPAGATQGRLGLGILGAEIGGSGTFQSRRGSWIAQARRGSNDFAGKLIGPERPLFWDAFAKLDFQAAPHHTLRLHYLSANDAFDFAEVTPDGRKNLATEYFSSYIWLTDQRILNPELFFETAISYSRVDRDRNGLELDPDVQWTIGDRRDLDVLALRQSWHYQASPANYLRWGFEIREFESRYDYDSVFNFEIPLARLRTNGTSGSIDFDESFDESHDSLYFTDRLQLSEGTTLEIGLRYDDHSQTDESRLVPRLNLSRSTGKNTILRAAWGLFNQSQRPYELAVEDGDTAFRRVERSEHRLLGLEHYFASAPRAELSLRVEAYQRIIDRPRPRWGNLYEPLNEFQEVEPDRVRITPDTSHAEGLEFFLRGRAGTQASWFVNYALASIEDRIGARRQPRDLDQTHSLNLNFHYRLGELWSLSLAWRLHTGWPTTPLRLEEAMLDSEPGVDEDGEAPGAETVFVPALGEPFSDRLTRYHRLDLRASRRWIRESGVVTLYADIQNVYDRKNQAGFDYEIDEDAGMIIPNAETWRGFFPSLGIRWEF